VTRPEEAAPAPAVRFLVRVHPAARRTKVGGAADTAAGRALIVRVAAPAVEGRANVAVVQAVADALGVRPRAVRVVRGATRRTKLMEAEGIGPGEVESLMGARPSGTSGTG
jgi:uncharacterized protein